MGTLCKWSDFEEIVHAYYIYMAALRYIVLNWFFPTVAVRKIYTMFHILKKDIKLRD